MSDELYDFYSSSYPSAKRICRSLQQKYDTEGAGSKKYTCSRYFKFQMMENKPVLEQVHDLQMIVHEIECEGVKVDPQMQVAAIIDKLPTSWKDFQKRLHHKQQELTIANLMARLRIEEEARKQDKCEEFNGSTKVNFLTSSENVSKDQQDKNNAYLKPRGKNMKNMFSKNNNFNQKKSNQGPPSKQVSNTPKFGNNMKNRACFVCEKLGHRAKKLSF